MRIEQNNNAFTKLNKTQHHHENTIDAQITSAEQPENNEITPVISYQNVTAMLTCHVEFCVSF